MDEEHLLADVTLFSSIFSRFGDGTLVPCRHSGRFGWRDELKDGLTARTVEPDSLLVGRLLTMKEGNSAL
jgi:hypothetical protein